MQVTDTDEPSKILATTAISQSVTQAQGDAVANGQAQDEPTANDSTSGNDEPKPPKVSWL